MIGKPITIIRFGVTLVDSVIEHCLLRAVIFFSDSGAVSWCCLLRYQFMHSFVGFIYRVHLHKHYCIYWSQHNMSIICDWQACRSWSPVDLSSWFAWFARWHNTPVTVTRFRSSDASRAYTKFFPPYRESISQLRKKQFNKTTTDKLDEFSCICQFTSVCVFIWSTLRVTCPSTAPHTLDAFVHYYFGNHCKLEYKLECVAINDLFPSQVVHCANH